jgi:hypothetical protein
MIYRAALILIALALPAGSAAMADSIGNGTKEEQKACAPDRCVRHRGSSKVPTKK